MEQNTRLDLDGLWRRSLFGTECRARAQDGLSHRRAGDVMLRKSKVLLGLDSWVEMVVVWVLSGLDHHHWVRNVLEFVWMGREASMLPMLVLRLRVVVEERRLVGHWRLVGRAGRIHVCEGRERVELMKVKY